MLSVVSLVMQAIVEMCVETCISFQIQHDSLHWQSLDPSLFTKGYG